MLRYIAHTLGTSPERLEALIEVEFDVTIDDTPVDDTEKDTEEQTMSEWSRKTVQQIDEIVAHLNGASRSEEQTMKTSITFRGARCKCAICQRPNNETCSSDVYPDDTEEQTMPMGKMTLTEAQFEAIRQGVWNANGCRKLAAQAFIKEGITITPAEPPAEMVKLARAYADSLGLPSAHEHRIAYAAHLAALQHVVNVVKAHDNAGYPGLIDRATILNALGAGGRDAG
jgi:hypothetical protein